MKKLLLIICALVACQQVFAMEASMGDIQQGTEAVGQQQEEVLRHQAPVLEGLAKTFSQIARHWQAMQADMERPMPRTGSTASSSSSRRFQVPTDPRANIAEKLEQQLRGLTAEQKIEFVTKKLENITQRQEQIPQEISKNLATVEALNQQRPQVEQQSKQPATISAGIRRDFNFSDRLQHLDAHVAQLGATNRQLIREQETLRGEQAILEKHKETSAVKETLEEE